MSDDTAGYVFSQTGKQSANILHLNDLASYKEHDTKRGIPIERQVVQKDKVKTIKYVKYNAVDHYGSGTWHKDKASRIQRSNVRESLITILI